MSPPSYKVPRTMPMRQDTRHGRRLSQDLTLHLQYTEHFKLVREKFCAAAFKPVEMKLGVVSKGLQCSRNFGLSCVAKATGVLL
eukprot:3448970-Amphidinium_carterae.1